MCIVQSCRILRLMENFPMSWKLIAIVWRKYEQNVMHINKSLSHGKKYIKINDNHFSPVDKKKNVMKMKKLVSHYKSHSLNSKAEKLRYDIAGCALRSYQVDHFSRMEYCCMRKIWLELWHFSTLVILFGINSKSKMYTVNSIDSNIITDTYATKPTDSHQFIQCANGKRTKDVPKAHKFSILHRYNVEMVSM